MSPDSDEDVMQATLAAVLSLNEYGVPAMITGALMFGGGDQLPSGALKAAVKAVMVLLEENSPRKQSDPEQ